MAGHLDITRISTGRNPLSPASGTGTARRRARRRKTRRRNLFGPDRGGQPLTQRPAHEPAGVAPRTPAGDARTVLLRHPQRAQPVAGDHSCRCARAIASYRSPSIQDPIPSSGSKLARAAGCSWSMCADTSAASESCCSVDVACRSCCCALSGRARPSQAASASNDGRGLCPAGFPPLEVTAADHAPSYPRPAHPSGTRVPRQNSAPSCVSESARLGWAYGRCASSHLLAVHR
jgi:hypothetical protein